MIVIFFPKEYNISFHSFISQKLKSNAYSKISKRGRDFVKPLYIKTYPYLWNHLNLRAGNAVYTVELEKQNPLSVTVTHYNERYTMEKDFFGDWPVRSADKSLDAQIVLKIGKFGDNRIQNSCPWRSSPKSDVHVL